MRTFWSWFRILAGFAIIGVLAWRLGTDAFLDGLRGIGLWPVLAALAIGLLTTVVSAWRWRVVASRLGLRLPLRQAVGDYYRAQFLNGVLPAGILGDVHRAVEHGRKAGDVARGVRAVVLERTAGQVVVVAAGLAVLIFRPAVLPGFAHDVLTFAGAGVLLVAIVVLTVACSTGDRWLHSASKWRRGFAESMADVRAGLLGLRTWPRVTALSLVALAGHLTLFVVAAHAAGATASLTTLLPLLVLALLAMGLPINVGGFGPREGVAALAFAAVGLGAQQGVTVAVVYGLLGLVSTAPGGAVLLVQWLGSLRRRPVVPTALPTRTAAPASATLPERAPARVPVRSAA
ncbi:lysylphosphatidylglycerol synthase transmembrane domain-containing protein [Amycolatopsis sp. CA-161197]|uniref:lysylphosphatidylglycerol synthase transmembrane domain-containing protein n=1 Tax=Amycolatopsis sp. CA-161197 TaxID=3239922 RepID=UPI003D93F08A